MVSGPHGTVQGTRDDDDEARLEGRPAWPVSRCEQAGVKPLWGPNLWRWCQREAWDQIPNADLGQQT